MTGMTLSIFPPLTNTQLTSLSLIEVLMYKGFKCLVIALAGLTNYIIVGPIAVSSDKVTHSTSLASTYSFELFS